MRTQRSQFHFLFPRNIKISKFHFSFIPCFLRSPLQNGSAPSPDSSIHNMSPSQSHVMMPTHTLMQNRVPRPPPLRTSLYRNNNNFTIQQAGSESQFPWFNQQNINHPENPAAYNNVRMAAVHVPAIPAVHLPRPFNAPASPRQNTLEWNLSAQPYYPHSRINISPPIPIISPPPAMPHTDDQPITISPPLPTTPSSPTQPHQRAVNNSGPSNNRISDPTMYTNNSGIQRQTQHGHNWTFRNQPQPRCPFLASDRNRRYVTSHHQALYLNQYPHQTSNIHYVRPAYAPHETLWYRQQNNQEMNRRHMMHPGPNIDVTTNSTNPHIHNHNSNVRILGPNNPPSNMVYCLSCDQQHPGNNRRMRSSYMCAFPGVSYLATPK